MQVGTITIKKMPDDLPPYGWLRGLAVTLLAGSSISAIFGLAGVAVRADLFDNQFGSVCLDLLRLPLAFVSPGALIVLALSFVLTILPISLFYILVRLAAQHIRVTLTLRIILGLTIGVVTAVLIPGFGPVYAARGTFLRSARPDVLLGLDVETFSIVLAAVTISLVARRSWFGLK